MSGLMETAGGEITVRFLANLKEVFREREARVELGRAATIGELLPVLCTTPARTQSIFAEPGSVRAEITVLLNGRNIAFLDSLDTSLRDGDLVTIFTPTAGG